MSYRFKKYTGSDIEAILDKANTGYKADEVSMNLSNTTFSVNTTWLDSFIRGVIGGSSVTKVTSITLNKSSVSLTVGGSETLTATVLPSNASNNKSVTWSSSSTSVATVSNGTITAKAAGTTTITCTATDGSNTKATCSVTVTAAPVVESKILIGNIILGSAPADATDLNATLTSSVIESNIASGNLLEKSLSEILSTTSGTSVATLKSIETKEGEYNYHIVLVPSNYSSTYKGTTYNALTGELDAFSEYNPSTGGFIVDGTETITYKGTTYTVYTNYKKIKSSYAQFDLTVVRK